MCIQLHVYFLLRPVTKINRTYLLISYNKIVTRRLILVILVKSPGKVLRLRVQSLNLSHPRGDTSDTVNSSKGPPRIHVVSNLCRDRSGGLSSQSTLIIRPSNIRPIVDIFSLPSPWLVYQCYLRSYRGTSDQGVYTLTRLSEVGASDWNLTYTRRWPFLRLEQPRVREVVVSLPSTPLFRNQDFPYLDPIRNSVDNVLS